MNKIINSNPSALTSAILEKAQFQKSNITENIFKAFDKNNDEKLDPNETDSIFKTVYGGNLKKDCAKKRVTPLEAQSFSTYLEKSNPDKLFLNGEIGGYAQRSKNTCATLAAIDSLSKTPEGRKAIKEAISTNENGDVTVKFHNIYKKEGGTLEYTFKPSDIRKDATLAAGDDDVKVLEYAIKQHVKKMGRDINTPNKGPAHSAEVFSLLTGEKTKTIHPHINTEGTLKVANMFLSEKRRSVLSSFEAQNKMDSMFKYAEKNPATIAFYPESIGSAEALKTQSYKSQKAANTFQVTANGKKINLIKNHAYVIRSVSDKTVTLHNPHGNEDDITIPRKTLLGLNKIALFEVQY